MLCLIVKNSIEINTIVLMIFHVAYGVVKFTQSAYRYVETLRL